MKLSSFKNARIVRSSWLEEGGRRLDCNPYMSGALEARAALEALKVRKESLKLLTKGHAGGIYNGPIFSRRWVNDLAYGVPFLSNSDMLNMDHAALPLLSKKFAFSEKLNHLQLKPGTTLISCSGTIGRTVYVRPNMGNMWSSQHIMKIVPDESKIPPGYLYAFLSSKFGVPLVISGTYGAIIQHIEPEHISALPVPRFDVEFERKIHILIQSAAEKRSAASDAISVAQSIFAEAAGLTRKRIGTVTEFSTTKIQVSDLQDRFDAPYHSKSALLAERSIDESPFPVKNLSEVVARFFKPPIFKRLWAESADFGRLFVSGNDIYRYQAEEPRYVSLRTPKFEEFLLKKGWVVFQAAGQIYGMFGRALYISGWLEDTFCADDVFRIVPHDEIDGAYLFLFFRTSTGQALIKRQASGNSIPRVWEPHVARIRVLWPDRTLREKFAQPIIDAHAAIADAHKDELLAIKLVEQQIEGGAWQK